MIEPPEPTPPLRAALEILGWDWPIHLTELSEEDPDQILISFDDVAGAELDTEMDDIAVALDGLAGVHSAYRDDRELILVEVDGGQSADDLIAVVDARTSALLLEAVSRRAP